MPCAPKKLKERGGGCGVVELVEESQIAIRPIVQEGDGGSGGTGRWLKEVKVKSWHPYNEDRGGGGMKRLVGATVDKDKLEFCK